MSNCIECKKEFNSYQIEVECFQCNGKGDVEADLEFGGGSYFKKCRNCNGKGCYTLTETNFCDEGCRESHFDYED